MIRRKKLTIFTDAKDSTTVLELKKIIEGTFLNCNLYFLTTYIYSDCRNIKGAST